jgi:hypothetical protein
MKHAKPAVSTEQSLVQKYGKAFVEKAENLHEEIVEGVAETGKKWMWLGRQARKMKDKGYWRAIVDPETKKPFTNFISYARQTFGSGKSQIHEAMTLFKELADSVPEAQLEKITQANARQLAKLPARKRTPEVIASARTMPEAQFQTEIIMPKLPKSEAGEVIMSIGPYRVQKSVRDQWEKAFEMAIDLAGDADQTLSVTEKAILALCANFIATFEEEHTEMLRRRDAEENAAFEASRAGDVPTPRIVDAEPSMEETYEEFGELEQPA